MHFVLRRESADGKSVRGLLSLSESRSPSSNGIPSSSVPASSSSRSGPPSDLNPWGSACCSAIPTLENRDYLIPPGTYTLCVTYSPRFKRPMPLVCGVIGAPDDPNRPRSGIRFHPGTKPEHSRGCILVSRTDEAHLCDLIASHTSVTLKIIYG